MKPIKTQPAPIKVRKPTPAETALRLILSQSKRQGHTCNVAHAVGVYPA
jgi:hypothetical protein